MKVLYHLFLICAVCVLAGCSRPEPTLDEAIDALTDDWGERYKIGASYSNNYAVLKRVIAVTNVEERIRLTWKLYNHFLRPPRMVRQTSGRRIEKGTPLQFPMQLRSEVENQSEQYSGNNHRGKEDGRGNNTGSGGNPLVDRAGMARSRAKQSRSEGIYEIRGIYVAPEETSPSNVFKSFANAGVGDQVCRRCKGTMVQLLSVWAYDELRIQWAAR